MNIYMYHGISWYNYVQYTSPPQELLCVFLLLLIPPVPTFCVAVAANCKCKNKVRCV